MFTLKRISSTNSGTFGVLLQNEEPFALTIEPPWRNNKANISCIPHGGYTCKRVNSPTFGDTFEIMDVDGRTHILFHKGNFGAPNSCLEIKSNTKGCVIVGEEFGLLKGWPAVLSSAKGFREFKYRTRGLTKFDLLIENCYGEKDE